MGRNGSTSRKRRNAKSSTSDVSASAGGPSTAADNNLFQCTLSTISGHTDGTGETKKCSVSGVNYNKDDCFFVTGEGRCNNIGSVGFNIECITKEIFVCPIHASAISDEKYLEANLDGDTVNAHFIKTPALNVSSPRTFGSLVVTNNGQTRRVCLRNQTHIIPLDNGNIVRDVNNGVGPSNSALGVSNEGEVKKGRTLRSRKVMSQASDGVTHVNVIQNNHSSEEANKKTDEVDAKSDKTDEVDAKSDKTDEAYHELDESNAEAYNELDQDNLMTNRQYPTVRGGLGGASSTATATTAAAMSSSSSAVRQSGIESTTTATSITAPPTTKTAKSTTLAQPSSTTSNDKSVKDAIFATKPAMGNNTTTAVATAASLNSNQNNSTNTDAKMEYKDGMDDDSESNESDDEEQSVDLLNDDNNDDKVPAARNIHGGHSNNNKASFSLSPISPATQTLDRLSMIGSQDGGAELCVHLSANAVGTPMREDAAKTAAVLAATTAAAAAAATTTTTAVVSTKKDDGSKVSTLPSQHAATGPRASGTTSSTLDIMKGIEPGVDFLPGATLFAKYKDGLSRAQMIKKRGKGDDLEYYIQYIGLEQTEKACWVSVGQLYEIDTQTKKLFRQYGVGEGGLESKSDLNRRGQQQGEEEDSSSIPLTKQRCIRNLKGYFMSTQNSAAYAQSKLNSSSGGMELPLVTFCHNCNNQNNNALSQVPHHGLCPKHEDFFVSGSYEILNLIVDGNLLGCNACMHHFENGRPNKQLVHLENCKRYKAKGSRGSSASVGELSLTQLSSSTGAKQSGFQSRSTADKAGESQRGEAEKQGSGNNNVDSRDNDGRQDSPELSEYAYDCLNLKPDSVRVRVTKATGETLVDKSYPTNTTMRQVRKDVQAKVHMAVLVGKDKEPVSDNVVLADYDQELFLVSEEARVIYLTSHSVEWGNRANNNTEIQDGARLSWNEVKSRMKSSYETLFHRDDHLHLLQSNLTRVTKSYYADEFKGEEGGNSTIPSKHKVVQNFTELLGVLERKADVMNENARRNDGNSLLDLMSEVIARCDANYADFARTEMTVPLPSKHKAVAPVAEAPPDSTTGLEISALSSAADNTSRRPDSTGDDTGESEKKKARNQTISVTFDGSYICPCCKKDLPPPFPPIEVIGTTIRCSTGHYPILRQDVFSSNAESHDEWRRHSKDVYALPLDRLNIFKWRQNEVAAGGLGRMVLILQVMPMYLFVFSYTSMHKENQLQRSLASIIQRFANVAQQHRQRNNTDDELLAKELHKNFYSVFLQLVEGSYQAKIDSFFSAHLNKAKVMGGDDNTFNSVVSKNAMKTFKNLAKKACNDAYVVLRDGALNNLDDGIADKLMTPLFHDPRQQLLSLLSNMSADAKFDTEFDTEFDTADVTSSFGSTEALADGWAHQNATIMASVIHYHMTDVTRFYEANKQSLEMMQTNE